MTAAGDGVGIRISFELRRIIAEMIARCIARSCLALRRHHDL
jgi:hypothetical protein